MGGGLFLLLCLLALFIGARARNSKNRVLSDKEIKRKERAKRIMVIASLVLVSLFLLAFLPFVIQDIVIAIDTHFYIETYLSMALLAFGLFTIYTIIKSLKK